MFLLVTNLIKYVNVVLWNKKLQISVIHKIHNLIHNKNVYGFNLSNQTYYTIHKKWAISHNFICYFLILKIKAYQIIS